MTSRRHVRNVTGGVSPGFLPEVVRPVAGGERLEVDGHIRDTIV